jgi:hypothetical protein
MLPFGTRFSKRKLAKHNVINAWLRGGNGENPQAL